MNTNQIHREQNRMVPVRRTEPVLKSNGGYVQLDTTLRCAPTIFITQTANYSWPILRNKGR